MMMNLKATNLQALQRKKNFKFTAEKSLAGGLNDEIY